MTIVALLDLTIRPDSIDSAPEILAAILAQTRAFPGNLGVETATDVTNPGHILAIERWESLEADNAYRAWRSTPEGASNLGELLAAPPTLTRYTV